MELEPEARPEACIEAGLYLFAEVKIITATRPLAEQRIGIEDAAHPAPQLHRTLECELQASWAKGAINRRDPLRTQTKQVEALSPYSALLIELRPVARLSPLRP